MSKALEILKDAGFEDDAAAAIEKQLLEHYRTREETEKKAARIRELEEQGEALRAEVAKLSDASETEELKTLVNELQERENERKAKDAEDAARKEFQRAFDAVINGKKFANERTEKSVFEDAFAAHQKNPELQAEEIVKPLISADGIFANPQQEAPRIPLPKDGQKSEDAEMKSFTAALFNRSKE